MRERSFFFFSVLALLIIVIQCKLILFQLVGTTIFYYYLAAFRIKIYMYNVHTHYSSQKLNSKICNVFEEFSSAHRA